MRDCDRRCGCYRHCCCIEYAPRDIPEHARGPPSHDDTLRESVASGSTQSLRGILRRAFSPANKLYSSVSRLQRYPNCRLKGKLQKVIFDFIQFRLPSD